MARIVVREKTEPLKLDGKSYCMCGLSDNMPFCDDSHLEIKDEVEEKTYLYTQDGPIEVEIYEVNEEREMKAGCCGGGCCGSGPHQK